MKRNFYKDGRRHTKERKKGKDQKKSLKVERKRDEMTAVDEKGKERKGGNDETRKE